METWLTTEQVAEMLEITARAVRKKIENSELAVKPEKAERGGGRGGVRLLIALSSLPPEAQQKYLARINIAVPSEPDINETEVEAVIYSTAPPWARQKADKYLVVLKAAEGMKGNELRDFIEVWNREHPGFKTSYQSVLRARKIYEHQGISGLLAQYGKNQGETIVRDDWFKYFKTAYLKEGAPSLYSCWVLTLGWARTTEPDLAPESFPSQNAFLYRLQREIPESAIYLARYGQKKWNRKYGFYIDRNYDSITAGECWVSDHAQVDIAVKLPGPAGKIKYVFAWITGWRDFKTGKWLGWLYHAEAPNSDHIFQAFYRAASRYGVPKYILIDNGKDYRCRDFAGGRRTIKVQIDEAKTTSMVGALGITPMYALPYNAQTKPIERDFNTFKGWFSKHMPGYRGGNIVERPEKLNHEVKTGAISEFSEAENAIERFIPEVINRMPSFGKLEGRSRDQAWDEGRCEINKVSTEALMLFCMRTSRSCTIGRNGIRDSELQVTYWAEWMHPLKGTKVYLRRDPQKYQEAWVFNEKDEYLGRALLAEQVAAIARNDIEKKQLKKAVATKKRDEKIAKSYIEGLHAPSTSEIITHMSAGIEAVNQLRGYVPEERPEPLIRMANTEMDKVIIKDRQMQRTGTEDLSALVGSLFVPERRIIHLFESDKDD
jgi:hypothetical protein